MPARSTLRTGGWAAALLVAALVTAACASRGAAADPTTKEPNVDAAAGGAALACGQPFTPPLDGRLTLTPHFPSGVAAGQVTVSGTVEVSAVAAVRGVASPRADVFLVRDGRIVAEPAAKDSVGFLLDLAAGQSTTLPGDALLVSCPPAAGPLPAGEYELWTYVVVSADDGTATGGFGGPRQMTIG